MKLDVKGFALTFGLVWGGAMLLVGVANSLGGDYGQAFLGVMASVYPGILSAPDWYFRGKQKCVVRSILIGFPRPLRSLSEVES